MQGLHSQSPPVLLDVQSHVAYLCPGGDHRRCLHGGVWPAATKPRVARRRNLPHGAAAAGPHADLPHPAPTSGPSAAAHRCPLW